MPEVRSRRWARRIPQTVDFAVLAGLLFAAVASSGTPIPSAAKEALAPPSWAAPTSPANFTVDPATYRMPTGDNVTLRGVWSTGSPLCSVEPLWFQWSVSETNATGFLNDTVGPSAVFTGDSFVTGPSIVEVRSGAVVDCGSNQTVADRSSASNVSVGVPLAVSISGIGPNPLASGGTGTLEGNVSGGRPPYVLNVQWGDGQQSRLDLAESGEFAAGHSFSAGQFRPTVLATDSAGDSANASAPEALSVGSGLRVAIVTANSAAELGVPVVFTGVVDDPPLGGVILFACSNASDDSRPASTAVSAATQFSCTFTSPGVATILFGVYPPPSGGPSATAILYETVVARPGIVAEPVDAVGEVGTPVVVCVNLTGGVPPLELTWNLTGEGDGGSEVAASDGGGVLAVTFGVGGDYSIAVRATDALGFVGSAVTENVEVAPLLQANASAARSPLARSILALVSGEASSGLPPIAWWVIPEVPAANASGGNGTLAALGEFRWQGTYLEEGSLTIDVVVVDGAGASWQTALEVPLAPSLSFEAWVEPGSGSPNETLALNVSIQGGWPPFVVDVHASDNESWNRSATGDGAYSWLLPSDGNGTLLVDVSLTDSLGRTIQVNRTVDFVPSQAPGGTANNTTSSPPTGVVGSPANATPAGAIDPVGVAAVILPVGLAGIALFVWRRRARKPRPVGPGPDPETTLRQIIEPADGAERFTVELLAEEQGVPLDVVRTTIERLVAEGKVHSETGADGEEVLSWSPEGGR